MNRSVCSRSAASMAESVGDNEEEAEVELGVEETVHGKSNDNDNDDLDHDNDTHLSSSESMAGLTVNNPPSCPSMVCTCVVELGPKICFATYDEESNEILIEESACSGIDFAIVSERYFALVRPNLLLVGNGIVSNEGFLETLISNNPLPSEEEEDDDENENEGDDGNDTTPHHQRSRKRRRSNIPYRVLRSSAFDSRNCMAIIMEKLRVVSLLKKNQGARHNHLAMDDPTRMFHPPSQSRTHSLHHRNFPISNYHMLGSVIDFESELQIKAVGGLLSFLHSTIFKLESNGTVTVANVLHTRSSLYMSLSAQTISSLQIFNTEHHPLVAARGKNSNSKEGSSLFSLLDRTHSHGGRQMLRNWMLKPLLDPQQILSRQDGVELFSLQQHLHDDRGAVAAHHYYNDGGGIESAVGALIGNLKEIGPISQILNRLQKCQSLPMDFVSLVRTLSAAHEICNIIRTDLLEPLVLQLQRQQQQQQANTLNNHHYNRILRYVAFLERILEGCKIDVLAELHDQICNIVDEDSTALARDTVCIRTGFSEKLDQLKENYSSLDQSLHFVCKQVRDKYPELGELAVVFVPQIGFIIGIETKRLFHPVSKEVRLPLPEDFVHYCDNEDGRSYYKSSDMMELDDNVGDLDADIKELEFMIVSDLEDDILDQEIELRETFLALSELDCIISFAIAAKDRNYVRPKLVQPQEGSSPVVRIKNGRHPLQEILVEGDFIPNDIDISGNKRVNVVTGPNFSGKSCYARQVGVLVYMAHIGSFLPCDVAHISLVDQIFALFSGVETCAVPQSSFQLDLTQMGQILRRHTSKSLVIIDEFGKGTSPASGIALLTSALRKFSSSSTAVVCTTHFLEIFSRKLLVDGQNSIKTLRMAVHIPDDEEDVAEPLFRLEEGVADSSAGIICAKMAGLHPAVVRRAKEIVIALKEGRQLQPNPALVVPHALREVLKRLLSTPSWDKASDKDVMRLLQMISKL